MLCVTDYRYFTEAMDSTKVLTEKVMLGNTDLELGSWLFGSQL
jgi:hypothetical protein